MLKNICKHCGKEYEYEPKRGTYKSAYCSIQCRNEFNRKDNLPQKRICEHCGKEYDWSPEVKTYGKLGNYVDSKRFCCYECGTEHKYTKMKNTTIKNFGGVGYASKELLKRTQNAKLNKYGNLNNYNKIKETNLNKYGVEYITQVKDIREKVSDTWQNKSTEEITKIVNKRKNTNLEKYGVEFSFQSDEIKERIKQTNLEKYGVEYVTQDVHTKEKIKLTNLKRYGHTVASKSNQVKEKIKNAMENKSKEENEKIQQKRKLTNLEKYGVEHSSASDEVKEKIKKTNLERYGKTTGFNYAKIKQTNLEKYGVAYTCLLDSCQKAGGAISKINKRFKAKLDELNIENELEFKLINKSYDIKVDNTLIEINPSFTHNSSQIFYRGIHRIEPKSMTYHQEKTLLAKENGYRCIHIWDWDNEDQIIALLNTKTTLYARNLTIKEVAKSKIGEFLEQYHLQGSCMGQEVCLGLYKDNDLIQIMTFGKPRYNKKFEWELLRLCTNSNYKVVGGAEKLFKHFIKLYNPTSIISYCDNSKFSGDVYKKLGMKLKTFGDPAKHWFHPVTFRHITDNLLRQRGYSQLHKDKSHKKGESNEYLMLEAGYMFIYDSGQSTYIWNA